MPGRPSRNGRNNKSSGTPITRSPSPACPLEIPYLEQDSPPIPIPVPPSQMPRFEEEYVDEGDSTAPSHMHTTAPHRTHNPFTYGYSPSCSNASGLARTIRATMNPVKRPAVPIVDLGNAAVGSGVEHRVGGSDLGLGEEEVSWARWDAVSWKDGRLPRTTRLLFVCYPSTLRIWDTTDLENISEILRLRISSLDVGASAHLVRAGVLPSASRCIGLAFTSGTFIIYSLNTHRVVSRLNVGIQASIESFEASEDVIVISTTSPPALHIFSTTTLTLLAEIPAARLALYVPPSPSGVGQTPASLKAKAMLSSAFGSALSSLGQQQQQSAVNLGYRSISNSTNTISDPTLNSSYTTGDDVANPLNPNLKPRPAPVPIYALSRRLLAYGSVSSSVTASPSVSFGAGVGAGTAQPAAAAAAVVAQSVWEGVRTLGGLAVGVARSKIGGGGASMGMGAGGVGRFFSRSAPERGVDAGASGGDETDSAAGVGVGMGGGGEVYITVVDLKALLSDTNAKEDIVVSIKPDTERLSKLFFAPDGCSIGAVAWDGTGVRVYQLRPRAADVRLHRGESEGEGTQGALEMYHLRRGRTGAVVDGVGWSRDGRWVAMGTRRGTLHVFGVNPYGGRMDLKSHWEGRVRDCEGDGMEMRPVEMGPIVRLRVGGKVRGGSFQHHQAGYGYGYGTEQRAYAPLTFIFVEPGEAIPNHLLPAPSSSPPPHAQAQAHPRSYSSHHTSSGSVSGSPPPHPHSPHALSTKKRPTNFQDVLVFDPADGSLALRRVVLEVCVKEHGMGMGMGISLGALGVGGTSISLPGMGYAGVGVGSPSSLSSASASGGGSGGSGGGGVFGQRVGMQGQEGRQGQEMELGARESTVMTWSLGGWGGGDTGSGWKGLGLSVERREGGRGGRRSDWLSQAELSTCSKSSKILPRSIYLSHQFSFHTLGEDYHALIRRYQLDIGGFRIDVRREVQVSAYSVNTGESFVEGYTRTLSPTSFNEPLASALANGLEHSRVMGVLPMFPNGTPGSRTRTRSQSQSLSLRNAIPIRTTTATRTIGDGMSGSLGRLRREIGKVRSPGLRPSTGGGSGGGGGMSESVPLEFDEEDEDFVCEAGGMLGDGRGGVAFTSSSRDGDADVDSVSGSGPSVSTPATSEDDWDRKMETREDAWGGWSENDRRAVEEVERFDDIDVVGLLDEEQEEERRWLVERQVRDGRSEKRWGRGR
ncbi:hypothetical protein H2248_000113 [Termitomyces sp. 'cryptogamus']|nr:hypothetical protein H2248_000113 [Termitomyces sp. 'cryptogamus']